MINECLRCGRPLEPEDRFCFGLRDAPAHCDDGDATGVVIPDERDTGPIPVVEGLSGLTRGMSVIVVQRGPEIGQRFELAGERLDAGGSADCDIMLDDVTVQPAPRRVRGRRRWLGDCGPGLAERHVCEPCFDRASPTDQR